MESRRNTGYGNPEFSVCFQGCHSWIPGEGEQKQLSGSALFKGCVSPGLLGQQSLSKAWQSVQAITVPGVPAYFERDICIYWFPL